MSLQSTPILDSGKFRFHPGSNLTPHQNFTRWKLFLSPHAGLFLSPTYSNWWHGTAFRPCKAEMAEHCSLCNENQLVPARSDAACKRRHSLCIMKGTDLMLVDALQWMSYVNASNTFKQPETQTMHSPSSHLSRKPPDKLSTPRAQLVSKVPSHDPTKIRRREDLAASALALLDRPKTRNAITVSASLLSLATKVMALWICWIADLPELRSQLQPLPLPLLIKCLASWLQWWWYLYRLHLVRL
jgi:hypothetical protein